MSLLEKESAWIKFQAEVLLFKSEVIRNAQDRISDSFVRDFVTAFVSAAGDSFESVFFNDEFLPWEKHSQQLKSIGPDVGYNITTTLITLLTVQSFASGEEDIKNYISASLSVCPKAASYKELLDAQLGQLKAQGASEVQLCERSLIVLSNSLQTWFDSEGIANNEEWSGVFGEIFDHIRACKIKALDFAERNSNEGETDETLAGCGFLALVTTALVATAYFWFS